MVTNSRFIKNCHVLFVCHIIYQGVQYEFQEIALFHIADMFRSRWNDFFAKRQRYFIWGVWKLGRYADHLLKELLVQRCVSRRGQSAEYRNPHCGVLHVELQFPPAIWVSSLAVQQQRFSLRGRHERRIWIC